MGQCIVPNCFKSRTFADNFYCQRNYKSHSCNSFSFYRLQLSPPLSSLPTPRLKLRLKPTPLSFMPTTTALVATTVTAMAWEMPDMVATPDTVLELTDIMLDTMASTETELRVLPVSTPLTFPFPVPVRSVMPRLRLNPRLRLMPLPTTVMLMVDTLMLPVLTDTDTVWEPLPDTMVDTWADTTVDTTDTPEFTHPITESAATTSALKSPVNFVFKKSQQIIMS